MREIQKDVEATMKGKESEEVLSGLWLYLSSKNFIHQFVGYSLFTSRGSIRVSRGSKERQSVAQLPVMRANQVKYHSHRAKKIRKRFDGMRARVANRIRKAKT